MAPLRLGVLATHPIQYYVPLYRALAARPELDLTVYYAHRPAPAEQGVGFGVAFEWDVDLMSGYRHVMLENVARGPNQDRFGDYDTPAMAALIRKGAFDAVMVHGWRVKSDWQAIRACWESGTRVYVRGDSQLTDDRSAIKRAVKRVIYPRFMGRFAACLAVGARSDAYFRYYGASRVVRSPHFVDNATFATGAARADRAAIRATWGASAETTVVLYVGKMIEKKRPLDVVAAVAGVPSARAVFVSDGPLRAAVENAAAGRAIFTGFWNQSRLPGAYAAADVLVLPSDRQETWGLVVNEAMASSVPAVVSDAVGCAPDLIVRGVTGYAYPAGDVGALAQILRTVAADPAHTRRMGAAAAAHVAAYSVDRAAAGVVEAMA